jgi:hypothetical protein
VNDTKTAKKSRTAHQLPIYPALAAGDLFGTGIKECTLYLIHACEEMMAHKCRRSIVLLFNKKRCRTQEELKVLVSGIGKKTIIKML